ncbi:hypothetical protein Dsin_005214 [Dipteronia sinensis]|uniref:Uncharacterized protein n=1 Tax=Dipteronia sinensis TaxID=43782 RepID=A0AAE0EEZ7_9ROSI|nr:hypothetical protein Dsin_005214 [Dipteronia sinensis]
MVMIMEEYKEENNNKKRARDESEGSVGVNSPDSKLARVDSVNSTESNTNASKDSDDSPVAMRIQNDLLDIFDDSDPDPAIQDLDSVIRSFEEEILVPGPAKMTLDSGESRPELGYLLEASDDELGLPPSFSSGGEEQKIETVDLETYGSGSGPVTLEDIGLGYDDGMLNFEPYKFAMGGESDNTVPNDFITLGGGLFESYESGDISEFLWLPESLSAS